MLTISVQDLTTHVTCNMQSLSLSLISPVLFYQYLNKYLDTDGYIRHSDNIYFFKGQSLIFLKISFKMQILIFIVRMKVYLNFL